MGLTRAELDRCRDNVAYWVRDVPVAPSNRRAVFDCANQVWSPPHRLAAMRTAFGLPRDERGRIAPIVAQDDHAKWERSLTLAQRNAIAVAFFDWVEWLRSKGLEMGICTAILSGKRDEVLRLVDEELNSREGVER